MLDFSNCLWSSCSLTPRLKAVGSILIVMLGLLSLVLPGKPLFPLVFMIPITDSLHCLSPYKFFLLSPYFFHSILNSPMKLIISNTLPLYKELKIAQSFLLLTVRSAIWFQSPLKISTSIISLYKYDNIETREEKNSIIMRKKFWRTGDKYSKGKKLGYISLSLSVFQNICFYSSNWHMHKIEFCLFLKT